MQAAVASSHYLPRGMVKTHRSTVFNNVVIPEIIQHGSWTNKMRITAARKNGATCKKISPRVPLFAINLVLDQTK